MLIFLACLIWPASFITKEANAQCRLCSKQTEVTKSTERKIPLRIEITANLDFSRVAKANESGGEVSVDPHTGRRRVGSGLVDLGGFAISGQAHVTGEPRRRVRIELPDQVILTAPNGAKAEVVGLATSLSTEAQLDSNGKLSFSFGGKLRVSGKGDGNFRGRIPITVNYE